MFKLTLRRGVTTNIPELDLLDYPQLVIEVDDFDLEFIGSHGSGFKLVATNGDREALFTLLDDVVLSGIVVPTGDLDELETSARLQRGHSFVVSRGRI